MALKLSILIATMPSRIEMFDDLMVAIQHAQSIAHSHGFLNQVEVLFDNSMEYNIGVKRNKLLSRAYGEYIVFIDDDDLISSDYVHKILVACQQETDCIGISGIITTNGLKQKQWHISKKNLTWFEKNWIYYRTPNHISPVRRTIALKAMFPEISYAEDHGYSRRLLPLLKSEAIVPGNIYHYRYVTKK